MKNCHPKKSLGQNFLINENVRQRIIASCDLKPTDIVLEIGPGKGALTDLIAPRVKKIIAVEKDIQLVKELKIRFSNSNVTIINKDILEYSFDELPEEVKVIGNLPYNIATPIIQKVLNYGRKFYIFYLTVQWEYGQRMVAQPSTKSYGSWSCFVQYHTDAQMLFKIGRASFFPVPKVQSCFLQLKIPKKIAFDVNNEQLLFQIIRQAFHQRRKNILNSLAIFGHKSFLENVFKQIGIDGQWRAENLSLENYVYIANILSVKNI